MSAFENFLNNISKIVGVDLIAERVGKVAEGLGRIDVDGQPIRNLGTNIGRAAKLGTLDTDLFFGSDDRNLPLIDNTLFEGIPVSGERYKNIFNYFSNSSEGEQVLSSRELTVILANTFGFDLTALERTGLSNIIDALPDEFKTGVKGAKAVLESINIVPIIDAAMKTLSEKRSSLGAKRFKQENNALLGLRAKIVDGYANQELANIGQLLSTEESEKLNPEELMREAQKFVSSPDYSPPQARELNLQPTPDPNKPPETATRPEMTIGPNGEPLLMDAEVNPNSVFGVTNSQVDEGWEDILRQSGELADLYALEDSGDMTFDMTAWSKWLDPQGTYSGVKPDGQRVNWKPSDAINYLYNLEEKGDKQKIASLQNVLRRGGYFVDAAPIKGIVDSATATAWNMFLVDAAKMNRSPADHYATRIRQLADVRFGKEPLAPIEDQAAYNKLIQGLAQDVLGRGISPTEVASLNQAIDKWRREALTLGFAATDPMSVDFNARIEEFLSKSNQRETEFNLLLGIKDYYGDVFA